MSVTVVRSVSIQASPATHARVFGLVAQRRESTRGFASSPGRVACQTPSPGSAGWISARTRGGLYSAVCAAAAPARRSRRAAARAAWARPCSARSGCSRSTRPSRPARPRRCRAATRPCGCRRREFDGLRSACRRRRRATGISATTARPARPGAVARGPATGRRCGPARARRRRGAACPTGRGGCIRAPFADCTDPELPCPRPRTRAKRILTKKFSLSTGTAMAENGRPCGILPRGPGCIPSPLRSPIGGLTINSTRGSSAR